MAGIYIHIPFCKKACHYCDFHFSTSLTYKAGMLDAIRKEIVLRKSYLRGEAVETIYLGGGTPSLLYAGELTQIIDTIGNTHTVSPTAEITIEANPDDLDPARVRALRATDVNRFSIGIQSFFEEDLRWMNRAHTAQEGEDALKRVLDAGFTNITTDLIYGFPQLSPEKWTANMEKTIGFGIPHISAYAMTVEPKTPLASFITRGKEAPMNDLQSARQFTELMNVLRSAGFEHYEISNFALPGKRSKHNSNYWNGVPYLGIGPSAHSYNGDSRQWNVANNAKYMSSIAEGAIPREIEVLTVSNRINEYLMTALRKIEGIDLDHVSAAFGTPYSRLIEADLRQFTGNNWIIKSGMRFTLTDEGKLFADHIASEIMVE
ncbi:radical SAM family heme chaperone HemW [Pedobacter sp. HMF7056]|uniref:Heme chaperone HemW n=1 Tax=Hufsiella ginkgonis TaxID=2695274 RepID=A0A7K1Y2U3_9SPHI|nr:radical SAM family heme chaperone HemW [Hufsiella ginkgonis]